LVLVKFELYQYRAILCWLARRATAESLAAASPKYVPQEYVQSRAIWLYNLTGIPEIPDQNFR